MLGAARDDVELIAEQPQIVAYHGHILDRPIVEIESQAGELALARLDQSPLGGSVAGEQGVALEDRPKHGHRLGEEPTAALPDPGPRRADERSQRLLPATDRQTYQQTSLPGLGALTREKPAGELLRAPRGAAVAGVAQAGQVLCVVEYPHRRAAQLRQHHEHFQLSLD